MVWIYKIHSSSEQSGGLSGGWGLKTSKLVFLPRSSHFLVVCFHFCFFLNTLFAFQCSRQNVVSRHSVSPVSGIRHAFFTTRPKIAQHIHQFLQDTSTFLNVNKTARDLTKRNKKNVKI